MCIDISTDAPGSCHIFCPGTGESPAADVDGNVFVYFVNAVADRSITFFLVQSEDIASTIVYLIKSKPQSPKYSWAS